MIMIKRIYCIWWGFGSLVLGGGNWNNADNAGPSYLNANNVASNSNRNIRPHLELRNVMSGSEQQYIQYLNRSNTLLTLWFVLVRFLKVQTNRRSLL